MLGDKTLLDKKVSPNFIGRHESPSNSSRYLIAARCRPTHEGATPREGHFVEDAKQIGAAITLQDRNPPHSYRADGYLYQRNADTAERKAIGSKKAFLKEIIKEVRVSGKEITLTYRLPLAPPSISKRTMRNGSLHCLKWWSQ